MGDPSRLEGIARYGIRTDHAIGITVTELRRRPRPPARPRAGRGALGLRDPRGPHPRVVGGRARPGLRGADGRMGGRPGLMGRLRRSVRQPVRSNPVRPRQSGRVESPRARVREAGRVRPHGLRRGAPHGPPRRRVRIPAARDPRGSDRRSERREEGGLLRVRRIGKRSSELKARAIRTAEQIERIDARSARWIAPDALRELRSDPVRARAQTR